MTDSDHIACFINVDKVGAIGAIAPTVNKVWGIAPTFISLRLIFCMNLHKIMSKCSNSACG